MGIDFGTFANIDLLIIGIAIAGIAILSMVVYLNNRRSITAKSFLFFALMTIAYGVINFSSSKFIDHDLALWSLRLTLFSAVWHAFSLYQLFVVFPLEQTSYDWKYKYIAVPATIIASLLTLTPLVFSGISQEIAFGQVANPEKGPGIALFGLVAFGLVFSALYVLINKVRNSQSLEKKQLSTVLTGTIFTMMLIFVFNFVLPVFYNNTRYVPLAPLYILPFIAFTTYAIVRHKLLDIKIVGTEILVFVLAVTSLIEVIISQNFGVLFFRSSVFLLVLGVGGLLVSSVFKEVKQRQELEILSTDLAKANEKLKSLDKARAEFISIASHQLRTPPATIKWYMSAILSGDFGKILPETLPALQTVQVTNDAQISTIDDLLNASRIERGKLEFFFQPGVIEPIVQNLVNQLQPLAQMKKLRINYQPPKTTIPEFIMDQEKIRQVINNMIDNAIKYTKQGDIDVKLVRNRDGVTLSVSDQGKGIRQEDVKKLFAKYSRGQDSATQATGLGLGMYVAKVIVEQHNGKIWAESAGLDKGSTFSFFIPSKNNLKATTFDLTK